MRYPDAIVIPLTKSEFAIVDKEDYPLVSDYRWHANIFHRRGKILKYARTAVTTGSYPRQKQILMHCLILGTNDGIDHWDDNGLNNRRSNLNAVPRSLNTAKSRRLDSKSGHVGIRPLEDIQKWDVRLGRDGQYYQGRYDSFLDAVAVYHSAARELYGKFVPICCDRMDLIDELCDGCGKTGTIHAV